MDKLEKSEQNVIEDRTTPLEAQAKSDNSEKIKLCDPEGRTQFDKPIITCLKMLNDRGYHDIAKNDKIYNSFDYRSDIVITAKDENNSKIIVFFCSIHKLNKSIIQNYLRIVSEDNCSHLIIIYNNKITSSANTIIQYTGEVIIEMFLTTELQFPVISHKLVPKHQKLDTYLSKDILLKYGTKMPVILKSDPISKYYHFDKGDVIKITRYEGTENEQIIFRIVK